MEVNTQYIYLCRGMNADVCPHALGVSSDFEGRIRQTVQDSGWPEFLRGWYGDKLNRHQGFQIHVSACPNGCSRPHIADIGFMRACKPQVEADLCTACGECAQACPDEAIAMIDGRPLIDPATCIDCGRCTLVCPVQAMQCVRSGWRVLAGGRLGRHPRLAQELEGWHDDDAALSILDRALKLYIAHYEPRKRFGRIMDSLGYATLLEQGE